MSQRHLYGPDLIQLNAPTSWQGTGVDATINDSLAPATIDTLTFIFEGDAGEFILTWMNTAGKGSFNAPDYKVIYASEKDPTQQSTRFDGYIDVSTAVILSESNPIRIQASVVAIKETANVLDQIAVITQGLLKKQGFLNSTHYVDFPAIKESKKNFRERSVIISSFFGKAAISLSQMIVNILGAAANILGVALPVGLVEFGFVAANTFITINRLAQEAAELKELFFGPVTYYKAASYKTILTQAFASKGYTCDFGILDDVLSKTYLFASQNEFDGYPVTGIPATGQLKPNDYGYIIGQCFEVIQRKFNIRTRIVGTVVHIKTRKDPYWFQSPIYTWDNTLVKTAGKYNNGDIKYDTERVKFTVVTNYSYDESDAWTLTEKSGDSHEIHRKLINEIDPKKNLGKGIEEFEIPWAMCVRKKPFDSLWDLFTTESQVFNNTLNELKDIVTQYLQSFLDAGINTTLINNILDATGVSAVLENRTGALKLEDDSFSVPKVLYLTEHTGGIHKIPENFKDFIGPKALYDNLFKWESPADVSDFRGQYRLYNNVFQKWSYEKFQQVQNNPQFDLNGFEAKYNAINWIEAEHSAVNQIEQNKPFDENITEEEIT